VSCATVPPLFLSRARSQAADARCVILRRGLRARVPRWPLSRALRRASWARATPPALVTRGAARRGPARACDGTCDGVNAEPAHAQGVGGSPLRCFAPRAFVGCGRARC
jgi:hypothetical protein